MYILKYFKIFWWVKFGDGGDCLSEVSNQGISMPILPGHFQELIILMYSFLGKRINTQCRYFEAEYSRYNVRNCWFKLPWFWTTESVIDHMAKERFDRQSEYAHAMFWFRYWRKGFFWNLPYTKLWSRLLQRLFLILPQTHQISSWMK